MSKNQAIQKLLHKSGLCIRKYSPNDFYEFLGLEKTELGDAVGWSSCNGDIYWIDFNHHRLTLDDGMEIYVIDMVFEPTAEWMEDL